MPGLTSLAGCWRPRRCRLILLIVLAAGPLEAGTIHVDSRHGDDRGNGTAANPKATIGAALRIAASGDSIRIAPGTYDESVTITLDRIVLLCAKPGQARLGGRLTLKCHDTVVDGLGWSGHNGGAIVNIYGMRNSVRRCVFREFGRKFACKGIWIRQTGNHGFNRIEHCLFEDWTGHGSSSCIKVSQNGSEQAFTGTVIRNNVFRRGNRPGNNARGRQHHLRLHRRDRGQGRRQHRSKQRGVSLLGSGSHEQPFRLEQPLREQPVV